MKRGYLLPPGCKDLIDALNLKSPPKPELPPILQKPKIKASSSLPVLPIVGELLVPDMMTVAMLAKALKQKAYYIVADLMEMGLFASAHQQLPFDTIAKVAQKYGYIAKKAP